jgi:hypothetical protein
MTADDKGSSEHRWMFYAAVITACGSVVVAACTGGALVAVELIKALAS